MVPSIIAKGGKIGWEDRKVGRLVGMVVFRMVDRV